MCCDLLIVSKNLLAEDHRLILITSIDVAGRLRAAVCNAFIGMFISCKRQHLKKTNVLPTHTTDSSVKNEGEGVGWK